MQQSNNNYLCIAIMCSKYKHNIAVFFLLATLMMLAESTLHGLHHARMHHSHDEHAKHSCSHVSESPGIAEPTDSSGVETSVVEDQHSDSCMRCAEYLAQEHSQLVSVRHMRATFFTKCQMMGPAFEARSYMVDQSYLRGPPQA
jgi:hypothetical protein